MRSRGCWNAPGVIEEGVAQRGEDRDVVRPCGGDVGTDERMRQKALARAVLRHHAQSRYLAHSGPLLGRAAWRLPDTYHWATGQASGGGPPLNFYKIWDNLSLPNAHARCGYQGLLVHVLRREHLSELDGMEVPGPAGRDRTWLATCRGLPAVGGTWPVVPTVAGGPGAARAYERRSGRARKVGGGLRYRCQHRRDVPGAAGSAARGGAGLAAGAARPGRGGVRGRTDRLRAGPVSDRPQHPVRGSGAVEAAAAVRRPGQDRRQGRPASSPVAAPG